jgi:hypothetical protein
MKKDFASVIAGRTGLAGMTKQSKFLYAFLKAARETYRAKK